MAYNAPYMARMYLRSPSEVAESIGARSRALRLARGLTQAALADKAGLGRRTVQRFEQSGTATVEVMVRIAFALGVPDTFDELFPEPPAQSIDEVLRAKPKRARA